MCLIIDLMSKQEIGGLKLTDFLLTSFSEISISRKLSELETSDLGWFGRPSEVRDTAVLGKTYCSCFLSTEVLRHDTFESDKDWSHYRIRQNVVFRYPTKLDGKI